MFNKKRRTCTAAYIKLKITTMCTFIIHEYCKHNQIMWIKKVIKIL